MVTKTTGVKKVLGKDVHHRNGNPRDNRPKNLAVTSKTANRSFRRTRNAKAIGRNNYADAWKEEIQDDESWWCC